MAEFKCRIKELRLEKKYTKKDVAQSLGISVQTLTKWENHEELPNSKQIAGLSLIFNINPAYLIGLFVPKEHLIPPYKIKNR